MGLFLIALATVGLSFGFAAFVFVRSTEREKPAVETGTETMKRVIGDIERLAALRERGALSTKEFNDQKALALSAQVDER